MSSTSPTSRKPRGPSWDRLSPEIRRLILESLMDDDYPLSRIVTVSREWQAWIERRNFARLRLKPSCLLHFPSMVHRNRAHVRYIWFCIEREDDHCLQCRHYQGTRARSVLGNRRPVNMNPVCQAFRELFLALSTWEPHGHLTLDISLYSPSDSQHWFPYLTFMPDTPSAETLTTRGTNLAAWNTAHYDDDHGWELGARQRSPHWWSLITIFNQTMANTQPQWWDELPDIPAVARVLLRQQNYRRWSPMQLGQMFAHFPRLQEVHYEPWREFDFFSQRNTDRGEWKAKQPLS